jgi:DNA-binding transcriptional LysR family regulator
MLPRYVCGDALEGGQLVALLEGFPVPRAWFRAHVTQHRAKLARIVRLLEWLKSALEEALPVVEESRLQSPR